EATYEYGGAAREALAGAIDARGRRSLWDFAALFPLPEGTAPISLGEGGTPLVLGDWLAEWAGHSTAGVYLKNETANPTWCSKDRGNSLSVAVAKALGAPGTVAITTGNHGASVVAYSARAGLPSVALMNPLSDVVHRAMVAECGGTGIVTSDPVAYLRRLVQEDGWFAVTSMAEESGPNPYGVEAYKTIAYEVLADLGGVPDAVFVAAASGDLLFGIEKGFRELRELGLADRVPRMIGCQAAGAAPLAQARREGLSEVPVLPSPATVAVSIGDATGGAHALDAVAGSGGDFAVVSDAEIVEAQHVLARGGLLIETASSATAAGLRSAAKVGLVRPGERVVLILSGSAVKWSEQLISAALGGSGRVLLEPGLGSLDVAIAR
ncbi:MAG TPA: pyridoxal-phosphate dependent enzyme, partial [Solirubrobacterales bacterium]